MLTLKKTKYIFKLIYIGFKCLKERRTVNEKIFDLHNYAGIYFVTIPTSAFANENQNINTEKVVISKTPYILRLTMLLIQNLNTEYV